MTIFDDFRALAGELSVDFMVPAKLVRTTDSYDKHADRTSSNERVVSCRAVMTPRRIRTDDGIYTVQTMATLTVEPAIGDRLEFGRNDYTVTAVEIIAPDGQPIVWKAVLA